MLYLLIPSAYFNHAKLIFSEIFKNYTPPCHYIAALTARGLTEEVNLKRKGHGIYGYAVFGINLFGVKRRSVLKSPLVTEFSSYLH